MKNETETWLAYSRENLASAKVLLESNLFNPCLFNVQQCLEKALKSILVEKALGLKRTHSIMELKNTLNNYHIEINISDEECDFMDSLYLPSKYPISSILPDYEPNHELCSKSISIAKRVLEQAGEIVL
ncbi:MAG: HEPN domain-containing protein [Bacteroidales bacterium]|nr:HEPN domain-containing protein [Bacteroidales bacterium]